LNAYTTFLLTKGLLNVGASIVAWVYLKDVRMAGFWAALAFADIWVGLWSLKEL